MNKKTITLFLILVCLFGFLFTAYGQDRKESVLSEKDVKLFIKTYGSLKAEPAYRKLDMVEVYGTIVFPEDAKNEALGAVLSRYGWDEEYFAKAETIFLGLYVALLEDDILSGYPNIASAIDALDAEPTHEFFTLQMKAQTRASLTNLLDSVFADMKDLYSQISAQDLVLIQSYQDSLMSLMTDEVRKVMF